MKFCEITYQLYVHKSGLVTWTDTSGIDVMRCPECGCINEWPFDDGGNQAECYGGCGRFFEYDK